MEYYKNKNIWIIGASSGIGRALAVELSRQGATLALSARSEGKLQALNTELGGKHYVFPLDVVDVNNFVQIAKAVQEKFSQLDSAIFMAAIYDPASLTKIDIETTHQMVSINLNGTFNAVHAILPILKAQGNGQIALCGSVAGYRGLPNGQSYSATKAAVINLAESLHAEEPDLDIKVINPGFVRTPLTDKNDFKMPMMIEASEAAQIISKELLTKKFEIHFPKKFTFFMKLLKLFAVPPIFLDCQENKMKYLITGGTGFIGSRLVDGLISQRHRVSILTRDPKKVHSDCTAITDIADISDDEKFDVIINLAGANISNRWTESYKDVLLSSRLDTTQDLVSLVSRMQEKPKLFISASAIGYYGEQEEGAIIDETTQGSEGFTHHLCRRWEECANKIGELGVRTCITRLGVVLGKEGGALKKNVAFLLICGLGGKIGEWKTDFFLGSY